MNDCINMAVEWRKLVNRCPEEKHFQEKEESTGATFRDAWFPLPTWPDQDGEQEAGSASISTPATVAPLPPTRSSCRSGSSLAMPTSLSASATKRLWVRCLPEGWSRSFYATANVKSPAGGSGCSGIIGDFFPGGGASSRSFCCDICS